MATGHDDQVKTECGSDDDDNQLNLKTRGLPKKDNHVQRLLKASKIRQIQGVGTMYGEPWTSKIFRSWERTISPTVKGINQQQMLLNKSCSNGPITQREVCSG